MSVRCRKRTESPVPSARENNAGDCGDGCGLAAAASFLSRLNGREPFLFAIRELHRLNSAGAQAEICVLFIGSSAERDHATHDLIHELSFPNDRSLFVRVMRPHDSILLPGDQNTVTVRQ